MTVTHSTVCSRVDEAMRKHASKPALTARRNGKDKSWFTLTFAELRDNTRFFSLGLRSLGVDHGDRVAILSENRPEWALADLGSQFAGAITVPIYPTLPISQVAHILSDSGAKAVITSDDKQLAKAVSARAACTTLNVIICMDGTLASDGVLSFDDVIERGRLAESTMRPTFDEQRDAVCSEDLISIVYTSGTTGNPKGAMLTHANMISAIDGALAAFPLSPENEVFLSFLPLCHVFERVTYTLAISMGAHTIYNDNVFKLAENMGTFRPTIMQCVPRVFESIHERVLETVSKQPKKRQRLFNMALQAAIRSKRITNSGRRQNPITAMKAGLADKIILSKVRNRFGGRLKFFVSGAAPLGVATADFFNAIGIPILEGWGLTETTAAATINPIHLARVGTVGKPAFGATVRLADDSEILVRGSGVMRGYWNLPLDTAEAIDPQGWFHTGDLGSFDAAGYLKIVGRKKDILVLANGKKVAPQPIETKIRTSPFIAEIVLIGDHAPTVSAIIVPNFDHLRESVKNSGLTGKNDEIITSPIVRKLIKSEIDRLSTDLADFEKIKRFELLDHAFTIEGGELTPTMKVKRQVVAEKYGRSAEGSQV